jgi:hypothetical protein
MSDLIASNQERALEGVGVMLSRLSHNIILVVGLLACITVSTFAQSQPAGDDPDWDPLAATKSDDYDPNPAGTARREQMLEMEGRIAALLPRPAGQDDETFQHEVSKEAERILRPYWEAMDRLEQEQARHEANMANPRIPMNIPTARRQFAERMASQMQFQQSELERRFRGFVGMVERYNQWQAFKQAHPEEAAQQEREAARRERLRLAQESRERREVERQQQWQVAHATRRVCQPLPEYIRGATNPDEALAAIRTADPDAGYRPNSSWHQVDRTGKIQEWPLVTIDTTNGPLLLAKDFQACRNWFRVAFPRG